MQDVREQWLIIFSTPVYLIIIALEWGISHLGNLRYYNLKNTGHNLYLMLLNSGIDLLFRTFYMGIWMWVISFSFYLWPAKNAGYWILLLLVLDFLYYWLHRIDHQVRIFWAVHVTHHSSDEYNFTVGFRSSVFQPLYRFIYFMPLPLLGFEAADIVFMYSATQIWGILVHTKMIRTMGWLEHILVTPSHHRVHHASNPIYLDKNMGMFLIVWDKMFGTFRRKRQIQNHSAMDLPLLWSTLP